MIDKRAPTMTTRHQYDGLPFFCTACGEQLDAECKGGDCVIESEHAAAVRAGRKRPAQSDLERYQRAARDDT